MEHGRGNSLHRVGPYIGRLRPPLARRLILKYSREGDRLWDPFCGSGTIPLECRLLSRHIIAADINPYACALTRAKLHPPKSEAHCFSRLDMAVQALATVPDDILQDVPSWVIPFFHKRTLMETIALAAELRRMHLHFHLGCLLDILHHQRPGFLSNPASHLVPYLRDRLYPRAAYPEAYEYRDPIPRLKAKMGRALQDLPVQMTSRFRVLRRSALVRYVPDGSVDCVITSPPYMDALDYARDNRLRLWLLGISDYRTISRAEIRRVSRFRAEMLAVLHNVANALRPGGRAVFVVGDVGRGRPSFDAPGLVSELAGSEVGALCLSGRWVEDIPDSRRARRNGRATKRETVLVFRRND